MKNWKEYIIQQSNHLKKCRFVWQDEFVLFYISEQIDEENKLNASVGLLESDHIPEYDWGEIESLINRKQQIDAIDDIIHVLLSRQDWWKLYHVEHFQDESIFLKEFSNNHW